MNVAIITGASSGLGREFALQIARTYAKAEHIDEMWLIARRKERLVALAREIDALDTCKGVAVPLDVADEAAMNAFGKRLDEGKVTVAYLVNNAGMGKMGGPFDISRKDVLAMVDLNCKAAVNMTELCLPHCHQGSRIIEVSSTSAFQPLPGLNVYAATKAFLLRYTKALRWEMRGCGIKITAVCPYWIKDTEFISIARTNGSTIASEKAKQTNGSMDEKKGAAVRDAAPSQAVKHFPLASKASHVARWALRDNHWGVCVSTPGPICFFHRIICKFLPHEIPLAGWELIRRL